MSTDGNEGPIRKMEREMTEKSPTEAVRDDLGGSGEPSEENQQELRDKVEGKKAQGL